MWKDGREAEPRGRRGHKAVDPGFVRPPKSGLIARSRSTIQACAQDHDQQASHRHHADSREKASTRQTDLALVCETYPTDAPEAKNASGNCRS
jgi:hypothetical protein